MCYICSSSDWYILYGMAQLQVNVHMCPTRVLHALQTRPAHVLHASLIHPVSGRKGCGSCVSLAAALLQSFALAWTRLMLILDVSRICAGCIWGVCKCYLGAELYRSNALSVSWRMPVSTTSQSFVLYGWLACATSYPLLSLHTKNILQKNSKKRYDEFCSHKSHWWATKF